MYSVLQFAFGFFALLAPSADPGTLVTTTEGPVQGTLLPNGDRQFLGIPFAADTSKYRFQPPQAAPQHSQVLDASKWGDSCPAELGASALAFLTIAGMRDQQVSVPTSENCLNLNIWAPATSRPQKTAVMIWVYGGSGKFGTSNTIPYNGSYFVHNSDDITIVSINYRTNIFGFPNAPGSWNVGLLDIEVAVRWVYNNIGKFGGDPERIVLFGESFGSMAVDAYTIRNPKDTIVKGVILESGVVALDYFIAPNNTQWPAAAKAVGCISSELDSDVDDNAVLDCMQSIPWLTLESAIIKNGISFTASPDGYTFFTDWQRRMTQGQYLKVPTLIGNNADEGDMFVAVYEATGGTLPWYVSFDTASVACTDVLFHCPAAQSAGNRTLTGTSVWRYIYSGVFDNINNGNSTLRAFHTAEIPQVFGTYGLSTFTKYPPTSTEIALSKNIQGAWVAFARNPSSGLTNYGWRQYNPNDNILHPTINILGNAKLNPAGVAWQSTGEHDRGCADLEEAIAIVWPIIHKSNGHSY